MPGSTTLDEELLIGLQQARKKKPRHFCLVGKGAQVLKLIVQKKKIKEGEIQKAKVEVKGNVVVTGVVTGEGGELAFEVVGSEPTILAKKIKEYIAEQTGLTVKPRWSVVAELSEVEEAEAEDEIGNESADDAPPVPPPSPTSESSTAPQSAGTGATETAPEPPPPPPGSSADGLLNELVARMNKLATTIQAAAQANPQRKADLLKLVAAFQGQVKAKDANGAQDSLKGLAVLLKELTTGGAPVPPSPPTSPTGANVPPPPTTPPPSPPQAQGESEQAEGETQDTSAASEAADEFRKNWMAARKTLRIAIDKVEEQLSTLAEALLKSNDLNMIWVAEEGLTELLGGLRASATTIDKSSSKTPAKVAAFAKPALAELQKRLQSAQVKVCDQNKFGVKVSIDKTISAAIDEMQKVLDTAA